MQNGSSSTMLHQPEVVQERMNGKRTNSSRSEHPHRAPPPENPRRSSLSEMTLEDAKSALLSTGGVLAPTGEEPTWHSLPLAFAVLPAIAGALFTNGEGVVTDILLLSLVAIFLHWFVKFPWEWYQNSRQGRLGLENAEAGYEEQLASKRPPEAVDPNERRRRKEAAIELQRHETRALISCFLGPLAGGYLMYHIRSQLARPSGGLISNFNLSVFVLVAELRPFAEVVRLVRDRNDCLQQAVHQPPPSRVEFLEAKVESLKSEVKELAAMTTKAIERDADVDALNRAVRRYEKKEALRCVQTETRLVEMDNRISDVLTLAAAAATARHNQQMLSMVLFEWVGAMLVVPFSLAWKVVKLPKEVVAKVGGLGNGLLKASEPRLLIKDGNCSSGKKKEKPRHPSQKVVKGRGY